MARKRNRVSGGMLFTWFILAGLILLFAPVKVTNQFHFAFTRIFRGPLSIGRNVSLSSHIQRPTANITGRAKLNHYANLERQLEQAHQEIAKLTELRVRYPWEGVKFQLADIVTASLVGSSNYLIINHGEDDGIITGSFVLGDNSVIGTVSEVSPTQAKVRLISDAGSKLAVELLGLSLKPVLLGSDNNTAKIRMIHTKYKIKVGDEIFAQKSPGFTDAPLITAIVTHCKRDDDNPLLWDIAVASVCDIENLTNVAVIIMNP